ncbi:hypothetical protein Tco_0277941 [Tanacetum coccineum]
MVVLESCPKHNMVTYLEKTDGNAEFHEIIEFLARSSIHNALTVSPVVSTTFVEQFWMSAKSKIINNVRYITATIAAKPVSILEASIRSDLLFDDADGIDSIPNQAIFDAIQLMGYEGDLTVLTFNKALFSPQWRFLFHTMNHCLSSKSTSWDQIPTNIATAVICLTTNQKYNFSKLIFDGMLRHFDAKKKFVMFRCFISIFLNNQFTKVLVPLDHFPINALTSKVFSFMVKKGKHFSGKVTPLFSNMLVQPTEDEDAGSERPSESQPTTSPPHPSEVHVEPQSDPSPRPSPTTHIPDSIPEDSGGNQGGQSSSDRSLSGNEGGMTLQSVYDLCISLCTQVTDQAKEIQHLKAQIKKLKKKAKPVITHHRAWMKSVSLKQRLAGKKSLKKKMQKEDEDTQDSGRTYGNVVSEEKETAGNGFSTEDAGVITDRPDEGTDDQTEGRSATPTTPTPTPTTFRDDKTIVQFLITMSQNKEKLKIARKVQEDWEAEEEVKKLAKEEAIKAALSNEYDFIQERIEVDRLLALRLQDEERERDFTIGVREMYDGVKDSDQRVLKRGLKQGLSPEEDIFCYYKANGNFRAFNCLLEILMESLQEENDQSDFWDDQQDWEIVTWRLYEACGVYILELKDGTVIPFVSEEDYLFPKRLLQRMLICDWKLKGRCDALFPVLTSTPSAIFLAVGVLYFFSDFGGIFSMVAMPVYYGAIVILDSEETLMLAEESRSKMLLKQQDLMVLEKKVNTTLVDYVDILMNSSDHCPSCRPTQVEEKVLVITALKNELRKLKGKDLADNVVTKNTIDNNVKKKIDVEPIAPKFSRIRDSTVNFLQTTIDQDAPSPSNSQTTPETQFLVISNDVEEENHDLDIAHMNNDPFFGIPIPKNVSESSSSSDVIPTIAHTAAPNS